MYSKSMFAISLLVAFILPATLAARDFGTAEEAKAMLMRAAKAVKIDRGKALTAFNKPDKIYREKDLYVFCFDAQSGEVLAHGTNKSLIGDNVRTKKDKAGKAYGEALFQAGSKGKLNEVDYQFPRPGETQLSSKSTYVTRVENLTCGVGFYK